MPTVIHKMDCIEGMKTICKENQFDVVVTSPPYNININYNLYKDNKPFDEYLDWMEEVYKQVWRVLKDDGSFFINLGQKPSDEFRVFETISRARKLFKIQNTIHWIKSFSYPEKEMCVGHFKPINSERFLYSGHEYIFHLTKTGSLKIDKNGIGVPYKDKTNVGRYSDVDLRDRGNVWVIPYSTVTGQKKHPTGFPEKLPEMCILLHGLKSDLQVCDPFIGSGTTARVCGRLGIDCVGFDIDDSYL